MANALKVEAMNKEEARINAIRERGELRRDRFLNARQRTIGVDVNGLQKQIDEKRLRDMQEIADAKAQEERDQYISMLMEQQSAEDRDMRRRELKELRGTWEYQSNLPKNNAPRMGEPVDAANCGVSAVQKFTGEDSAKLDRLRLQKEQMRSWNLQQMAEKQSQDWETKEDEERYANYVKMLTERRAILEQEERDERNQVRLDVARENMKLSLQKDQNRKLQQEREMEEKKAELQYQLDNKLLCEDTAVAFETTDGRVRRDGFKGYSKEQIALFYQQNQDLIAQRKAEREASNQDAAWAEHSQTLRYLMEENEAQRRAQAQAALMDQRETVKRQAEEERQRRADSRAERFGTVGAGFFDGFGKSVR